MNIVGTRLSHLSAELFDVVVKCETRFTEYQWSACMDAEQSEENVSLLQDVGKASRTSWTKGGHCMTVPNVGQ